MELVKKLNSIIGQLEEIQNLADPDIDIVRKKSDYFENEMKLVRTVRSNFLAYR